MWRPFIVHQCYSSGSRSGGGFFVIFLGAGTFSLEGAHLDILTRRNVKIIGHPDGSILDAQGLSRHFDVGYGAKLILIGVTLINGYSDYGGAIRVPIGYIPAGVRLTSRNMEIARLQLEKCEIRNCTATADGGALRPTRARILRDFWIYALFDGRTKQQRLAAADFVRPPLQMHLRMLQRQLLSSSGSEWSGSRLSPPVSSDC